MSKILRRVVTVILFAILMIQSGMMIFFGNQKQGFHEDEIYSFLMSNWSGYSQGSASYINEWKDQCH